MLTDFQFPLAGNNSYFHNVNLHKMSFSFNYLFLKDQIINILIYPIRLLHNKHSFITNGTDEHTVELSITNCCHYCTKVNP